MNRSVGKAVTAGFALTIIMLLISGWLSYRNVRRLSINEGWVTHTYEVLAVLRDSLTTLADAETGQRGYLITGEPAYLEPYRSAHDAIAKDIDHLQALTADNPAQQVRLPVLRETVERRLATLDEGIKAREISGPESARGFILGGKGKREMDSIRSIIAAMEKTELDLLGLRQRESADSYRTAVATVSITTALGLGLVATAYLLAAREVKTRLRGLEALAQANDELEERVEQRTADLGSANESLRRSNRELEQFASVASHDLQEPLRKIQAFGDRLQVRCSGELGEQGRDYLQRMLASAGRMRSLIDALLTFSRVTTKAQPFVQVDLAATAEDVVSDLEEQMRRTGGRIDLGPLPTIEADPLQMRQLIQNLVGNALKFSRPNEAPMVEIASRPVRMADGDGAEDPSAECCEISVRDNGIGFEEVYLDRIFELFQRLHGRQEYEGTGMGLAICRKIVERHKGHITAKSAPGEGATFLVTLPLRQ